MRNYHAALQIVLQSLIVLQTFFSHHIFHLRQNLLIPHLVAVKKKTTVKKYSTISIGCRFKFHLNSFLLCSFGLNPCFLLALHVWICTHLFGRYNLPSPPIPHPFGSHSYCVSPLLLMMTVFWLQRRLYDLISEMSCL